VRKAGTKPLEYLKVIMKDVLVSSVSTGGNNSEDRLTETITLNFSEFKVEYSPQKADGSAGAVIGAGWNMSRTPRCRSHPSTPPSARKPPRYSNFGCACLGDRATRGLVLNDHPP